MGQHSSTSLTEEPTYVSQAMPSSDNQYASLAIRSDHVYHTPSSQYASLEIRTDGVYDTPASQYASLGISADNVYDAPFSPEEGNYESLPNPSGHLYTVTIVPTDLSKTLKLDANQAYQLELKNLSICLSGVHTSGILHEWPLNLIRRFHVDSKKKHFIFEPGRRTASGPGMIECRSEEGLGGLLESISQITGLKFNTG